jgi:hypothetical protein
MTTVKVAAIDAAPVFLDRSATTAKAFAWRRGRRAMVPA